MALEDAAVLSRLVAEADSRTGIADAFRRLEATRKSRTSKVQLTSRANKWLREKTDVDWVYRYNPWTTPLAALETAGRVHSCVARVPNRVLRLVVYGVLRWRHYAPDFCA
jgi:2-polyprenyl-6-methoxyphenol hydroxylase-like FAD-dependent oxidoreductase